MDRQAHWNEAYRTKGAEGVSWFEERPALSLELVRATGIDAGTSLIDIGGGASRLVDALLEEGLRDLSVLDLSEAAVESARARLGDRARSVEWIVADVTGWRPERVYDIWHDRAALHFLTAPEDQALYARCLEAALAPDGHAIVASFAPDGPKRCSDLPVVGHDGESLSRLFGPSLRLVDQRRHLHRTPFGTTQQFQFSVFRRV